MAAVAALQRDKCEFADTSSDFVLDDAQPGGSALAEIDAGRLAQRQKQIDYGKNTLGYVNYLKAVPRERRRCRREGLIPIDPITPDVRQVCSKRAFDGQIRKWRRMLHEYDPSSAGAACKVTASEPEAANPTPPATAGPGDKRRCRAGAAVDGGKRARVAKGKQPAARSIYDDWDEDDIAV
ncbi:hypothetical protein WJX81_004102 [Elliptochloris bilobata]|uniref:Histone RNA hairpin-binding protein RNA-binding domain-containing protein n=1 Tax=Elliptochloris bilobata TaxID=381761 RepID=A0AAW1RS32_9CHLO